MRGTRIQALMLTCIVSALIAISADAQAVPGTIEAGIGWGRLFSGIMPRGSNVFFPDRDIKVDDAVLKGFWLGSQLTPHWAVEVAVRRAPSHLTEAHSGIFPTNHILDGLDYAAIEGLALYTWKSGNFVPYVGAGGGITSLDIDDPDPAVQDSNRFCFSFTGGAKFYVARWAGLRFDLRERVTEIGGHHWLRDPEVLAGCFLTFGKRR